MKEEKEKKLVFLGIFENEEMYINLKDVSLDGWSLMGLRPETEKTLRENRRDESISDIYDVSNIPSQYLDEEKFQEENESNWHEFHDVQGEYVKDGETYYLGFGSGTDIFHFFKRNKIKTYKDFIKLFDDVNLTENQFKKLLKIMKEYKKDKLKGYKSFMGWQKNISEFPKGIKEE